MEIDLVFNELSLQNPASDQQTAREWMSNFIKTVKVVKSQGVKVYLRTQYDFHKTILANEYPLRSWLNDQEVAKEEQIFIKTLATGSPFSTNIVNSEIQDIENNQGLSEFYYQGIVAVGLGVAYLLDTLGINTLAISFISDECWNLSKLEINYLEYTENGEEDRKILEIRHASCNIHVQDHATWIQGQIQASITDGEDIWDRKEELFPNLEFCDNVSKQLKNIQYRQLELAPVYKTLIELQKCCQNWKSGGFSVTGYPLDESGESEPTLNKYGQERLFTCPDNEERLFERHIKLRSCNWRIHFFPLQPGKVIIGYVGRHLPTVNYRT
jgi:hypothetical protein